jgi:hypothetical protein
VSKWHTRDYDKGSISKCSQESFEKVYQNDTLSLWQMNNATANFEHCRIEYGYNGITLCNGANVTLYYKCYVSDNECAGICRDSEFAYPILDIYDSYITNNLVYGINLSKAYISMLDCMVTDNHFYGIQLSNCEGSIENTQVLFYIGLLQESQFAIHLDHSPVYLYETKALTYGQGGVKLTYSSPYMYSCEIKDNDIYGLYATTNSAPNVQWTTILGHYYNVYAQDNSYPNLGTQTSHGNNSIYSTSMGNWYYVVNANLLLAPAIFAEYNWWGSDPPDETRFSGIVDYTPWLSGPPGGEGGPQSLYNTETSDLFSVNPNPIKSFYSITFTLHDKSRIKIALYDVCGSLVKKITDAEYPAGVNTLKLNTARLVSGIYFLQFVKDTGIKENKKILVVK